MKTTLREHRSLAIASTVALVLAALVLCADSTARGQAPAVAAPVDPAARPHAVEVLWDITHGVYSGYQPSVNYLQLSTLLGDRGYSVTTTAAGVDNIDLSPYSILVVCLASAWDTPYTASEVAAVLDFMAQGKGVLVLADGGGTPVQNIHPITNEVGVTCGFPISNDDLDVSDFEPHPIFTGIGTFYMRAAGWLQVDTPSVVLAREPGGLPVVAARPDCRMIVVGDVNFCENNYIASADNQQFAINLFDALETSDCSVRVHPTTWGGFKAIYR